MPAALNTHHVKLLSLFVVAACLILAINFGLRSSMGFFMAPISSEFGYGREVFAFSLALQNLCWGLFQPFTGAFADRFGTFRTLVGGAAVYALGLYITATTDSVWSLHSGAGILIGMGIAGTGFGVILPALARMVAPEKRAFALGLGTAAGSAGQLLVIPIAQAFISLYGWHSALLLMVAGALMMIHAYRVRGHLDAMEVGMNDAPRANEMAFVLVMSTGARVHDRAGGLAVKGVKGEDGLR